MSQRIVLPWLNTNIPGAYVNTQVISNQSGLASSGVILIMGEADGGPDYSITKLANNFFGPTAINTIRGIYTSGPIVDAFLALAAPSNDPDIVGTASNIYVIKTNRGTQSSALVPNFSGTYGTFDAINWGVGGNLYNYTVTSTNTEVAPAYTGITVPAFGAPLNGDTFTIRLNGGAASVVTLSATAGNHDTIAHLVTELNGLLPAGITASAGVAVNTLVFTMAADSAAYANGWGKSFELIDSTPGDLAALGLAPGITVSSQEPSVEVQVINTTAGVNETLDVAPVVALNIGYTGTTATMTINATTLTTTVTGGTGTNLSITLSQYTTVAQLAAFINAQPGYSASSSPAATQLPTSSLDEVTAIGIASTGSVQPGRVKDSIFAFEQILGTSTAIVFTNTATAGLPQPGIQTYLAGGTRGATLAADIVNCIGQMAGIQVNIIVPLFSQNASVDIAAGNTDPASTYTIDAINEQLKSHCIEFSTPTLKRNRMAICSINDTYVNCKAQAQSLATYRCSITCQQIGGTNSLGLPTVFLPWYGACIAAGMQAGGFYKSIVNHLANVSSFIDPVGYDSGDPAEVSDALTAGLLVLTLNTSGIPWVSDQTTYGLDTNFVYNSIQAVYLSDILALDLAQTFQNGVVGKSVADVSAASALSLLQQRFDYYKKLKMTTTSSDAPLGYKNASIQLSAPSMFVSVEAKLTTSIYFVGIELALSAVQQSA